MVESVRVVTVSGNHKPLGECIFFSRMRYCWCRVCHIPLCWLWWLFWSWLLWFKT